MYISTFPHVKNCKESWWHFLQTWASLQSCQAFWWCRNNGINIWEIFRSVTSWDAEYFNRRSSWFSSVFRINYSVVPRLNFQLLFQDTSSFSIYYSSCHWPSVNKQESKDDTGRTNRASAIVGDDGPCGALSMSLFVVWVPYYRSNDIVYITSGLKLKS